MTQPAKKKVPEQGLQFPCSGTFFVSIWKRQPMVLPSWPVIPLALRNPLY